MLKFLKNKTILIKYIILIGFILISNNTYSQYFIGKHKTEIIFYMKNNLKGFSLNTSTINSTFKYLKYENFITQETILFFLNNKDTCTSVRWISDYSNINNRIEFLNKNYKKTSDTTWYYVENNKKVNIILKEEEWYFTINFLPLK